MNLNYVDYTIIFLHAREPFLHYLLADFGVLGGGRFLPLRRCVVYE